MQISANEVNGEAMKVVERITSTNSFVTQLQLSHRWLFISSIHWLCRKTGQPIRASVNDPSAILKRIPDALSHPMLKLKGSLRIVKPTSLKLWRMTESQRILKKNLIKSSSIFKLFGSKHPEAPGSVWKYPQASESIRGASQKASGCIWKHLKKHPRAFERKKTNKDSEASGGVSKASESIRMHPDASGYIGRCIQVSKRNAFTRNLFFFFFFFFLFFFPVGHT